ncbi:hypothetical protein [Pseudomonas cichorii]|nr:hypothetical protein [Pseudomonas cichorii]
MSNSDKITEGMEKRREYLRSQSKKRNHVLQNQLLPPEVAAILAGLPEGLLPVSALTADLDVKIPYWNVQVPAPLYAEVNLSLIDSKGATVYSSKKKFDGPISIGDFPLEHNIPQSGIPHEGVFRLEYHVFISDGTDNHSAPRTITIDRTPPYYNLDPTQAFPVVLTAPAAVITDATFAGGETEFICTVAEYTDITDDDVIVVYWGPGQPETPDAPDPAFGPVKIPADRKIPISKDTIVNNPNGATYAVYWLTDKAGNVSSISKPLQLDVQLGALPANLKDPLVPLGSLVDLADAHMGVDVLILAYDNPQGTVIHAKWGATSLLPTDPGSMPRDVSIRVPWPTLKGEYTGGPGEETVQVSYQVKRGTLVFPAAPLVLDVEVDFSTNGPTNPNEPDPTNPDLAQVHLQGTDGIQDTLTPSDVGKDITATVALYDPVVAGEILKLYWGSEPNPVASFTVVNEAPGDPINFIIPWVAIEAQANNPALPMYYSINTATGNNPTRSIDTPVNVGVLIVGFDPVSFPDIFEDSNGNKTLSCASLYSEDYADPDAKFGFRVAVPGDKDLNVGDAVTVVWRGYEFDGITEIPATRFTFTKPSLTQEEVTNGFIVLVEPYDVHILPIEQGYADVTYSVTQGGVPVPADPMPGKQYVSLIRPGGLPCTVPPTQP